MDMPVREALRRSLSHQMRRKSTAVLCARRCDTERSSLARLRWNSW